MRTLLVASDLSARSDRAVTQAARLAGRFGARLVLLHVVDDELPAAVFAADREQAYRVLTETAGRQDSLPRDRIVVRVEGGLDFQVILAVARDSAADLVVLGAHRRSILEDVLTGTTVERVVRSATTPVLVVKRDRPGDYVCTLAAVDLKEEEAAVLRMAHRMADGQTLYAMHVLNDAVLLQMAAANARPEQMDRHRKAMGDQCEALLREIGRRASLATGDWLPLVGWGLPAQAILDSARALQAGLCVIGTRTRGKGPMQRLLFGSVAERLLLDMHCDVLAVPLTGTTPLPGAEAVAT